MVLKLMARNKTNGDGHKDQAIDELVSGTAVLTEINVQAQKEWQELIENFCRRSTIPWMPSLVP